MKISFQIGRWTDIYNGFETVTNHCFKQMKDHPTLRRWHLWCLMSHWSTSTINETSTQINQYSNFNIGIQPRVFSSSYPRLQSSITAQSLPRQLNFEAKPIKNAKLHTSTISTCHFSKFRISSNSKRFFKHSDNLLKHMRISAWPCSLY